ncbi:MAG: hypothetical protein PHW34_11815 [Hespellia sp.]|nr:hypothetical protein [Hespellia sp.]
MMNKRGRIGSALLLAVLLAVSVVTVPKVQAATAVDTARMCSVSFQVDGTYPELKEGTVTVPVKLYRVASITQSGSYVAEDAFTSMDFGKVDSETTAEEWSQKAKTAEKIVTDQALACDAETTIINGTAQAYDLTAGLYLIKAEEVGSPQYRYRFTPYLVSLPNNYYAQGQGDEWIYDIEDLGLKPEQTLRYGGLLIKKTLSNQNITMGEKATFVFKVVISTPQGETMTRNVALTFDVAGEKTAAINDIPAESKVVVTEVYSGASYTQTAPPSQTATIFAEEMTEGIEFVNEHNGKPNGGYGISNNFTKSEDGYDWNKDITDNATDSE